MSPYHYATYSLMSRHTEHNQPLTTGSVVSAAAAMSVCRCRCVRVARAAARMSAAYVCPYPCENYLYVFKGRAERAGRRLASALRLRTDPTALTDGGAPYAHSWLASGGPVARPGADCRS